MMLPKSDLATPGTYNLLGIRHSSTKLIFFQERCGLANASFVNILQCSFYFLYKFFSKKKVELKFGIYF